MKAVNLTQQAMIDIIPLSLAVIPWGILCGSLAIEAGLSAWQAQLMSLLIFAGAAQLSAINLMGAGTTLPALLNSTAMISARHLLYSAAHEGDIRHLPWIKRVVFAFFLTDEMFAVVSAYREKHGKFHYRYAVVAGVTLGLDFAIAAIFIAMTVPRMRGLPLFMAAGVSGLLAVYFEWI